VGQALDGVYGRADPEEPRIIRGAQEIVNDSAGVFCRYRPCGPKRL